ncbi:TetR/AcrR family transcriptional regulator [Novilysobacter erysipheiresistens]|uniref:TetR/AcrR family transcriptional regulator n=1 Tax=Novilysobacter erysipheiresistens TaxID=1749332 RepID=A0ABU7Z117_9GAMM
MKPDQPPRISGDVRRGRPSDPGKHDAILDNARRMFTRLGFDRTSMDELAQHAGVSKATIYNHFDSKEALFDATFERLLQALPPPAELIGGPQGELSERLHAIGCALYRLATSPLMVDIQRMLILAHDTRSSGERSFWQQSIAPYQHAFSELLRAQAGGDQLAIDDFERATSQFFSLAASEPFIRLLMGDSGEPEKATAHVDAAVRAFLRAYAGRGRD